MKDIINFVKMNGLGNKIIVIDVTQINSPINISEYISSFNQYSDTKFDQLMVIDNSKQPELYDFNIVIYNQDGSLAAACGNGMRCVMKYLYVNKQITSARFMVGDKLLTGKRLEDGDISINMGQASFKPEDIGLATDIELNNIDLSCNSLIKANLAAMPNPHLVFWVDDWHSYEDLKLCGPALEKSPIFKNGVNVTIALILNPHTIKIATWERGAGLTEACGSAACAVSILGKLHQNTADQMTIQLPGGELKINIEPNNDIIMIGAAELEFYGQLNLSNANISYQL